MRQFIDAVKTSLDERNWYAALFLTLTLPDMCAVAEDQIKGVRERYMDWCERYLVSTYIKNMPSLDKTTVQTKFLSAWELWLLRNGVLHEGSSMVEKKDLDDVLRRVVFVSAGSHLNRVTINGYTILMLTVPGFCREVIDAVERWLIDVHSNAVISEHLSDRLAVHTESFAIFNGSVKVDVPQD